MTTTSDAWRARTRSAMERGEYLLAFDTATAGTDAYSDDLQLQYQKILALARAGATDHALATLDSSALESRARDAHGRLQEDEDIAALRARLEKDRALASRGSERQSRAREAAARYEAIYQRLGRPYSCINAATMWLMAGDEVRARELAEAAMRLRDWPPGEEPGDSYWTAATEAEAALLLEDMDAATDALHRAAGAAAGDLAALATTRRQLLLLCSLKGIDEQVLAPVSLPSVVHYGGHMIAAPGNSGRFPAAAEGAVAEGIRDHLERHSVGVGVGSLACGADILFAETLLDRKAELHVVLPFAAEQFKEVSVRPGGSKWLGRFDRCLREANSVTQATAGEYLGDDSLFEYGARLAMGHALIRSTFLTASVEQVMVWDGSPSAGREGTAADIKTWQEAGRRTHVISVAGDDDVNLRAHDGATPTKRVLRAMLFADVSGFSKVSDSQTPAFLATVMAPLADTLDQFESSILLRDSWGDGLYVVLRNVTSAAYCALALQDTMRQLRPASAGLPEGLGLRIAGHSGPVFELEDPVRKERNFYGVEVTRTARIEPRTPEGDVYVTDPFAALIALEAEDSLSCQYVGHIQTAKGYGVLPAYVLKRRT